MKDKIIPITCQASFFNNHFCILTGNTYNTTLAKNSFNDVIMSDTDMEKTTNREVMARAHGKVLIGGLGIGLIIAPMLDFKEVERIMVIEKNQEVIDMVLPHLKKSLRK